jgi:hypothetical protein
MHRTGCRWSSGRKSQRGRAGWGRISVSLDQYVCRVTRQCFDKCSHGIRSHVEDGYGARHHCNRGFFRADVAAHHPDAAVIVPPRCTAVLSEKAATAPTQRDRHLQCITETDRVAWQKASGYNRRAKVEAAIGRSKQVIGDGLRSRKDKRRVTEVNVAVCVLNRMLELGRPSYVRIV